MDDEPPDPRLSTGSGKVSERGLFRVVVVQENYAADEVVLTSGALFLFRTILDFAFSKRRPSRERLHVPRTEVVLSELRGSALGKKI